MRHEVEINSDNLMRVMKYIMKGIDKFKRHDKTEIIYVMMALHALAYDFEQMVGQTGVTKKDVAELKTIALSAGEELLTGFMDRNGSMK